MKEYWEITRERAVATQAVWGMKPAFELNKLTRAQHGTLNDSLPTLAQGRDTAENNLTDVVSAKHTLLKKLANVGTRLPGLIDGLLDDEDELKDQLDAIFAVEPDLSEAHILRRGRLLLPLWLDVDAARTAAVPPKPPLTIDYKDETLNASTFAAAMTTAVNIIQKTEAERLRDVTNAKSALRTADRKTDRGNKRWYKAWLKTYPAETPEGNAALSNIPTEQGTPEPASLEILSLTAQVNHTVQIALDPLGGVHATTKELQYQLPGESEFGHSTAITGNSVVAGPFTVGATVNFRTRVANSHPGTVTSATQSVDVV